MGETIPFVGDGGADVLDEAIEACEIIERDLAGRAAKRRSAGDLAALSEALDALLATVGDPRAFVACDLVLRSASPRLRAVGTSCAPRRCCTRRCWSRWSASPNRIGAGGTRSSRRRSRVRLVEMVACGDGGAARRAVESIFDHLRTGLLAGGGSPNGDLERVRAM